jgi:hypothetical protein
MELANGFTLPFVGLAHARFICCDLAVMPVTCAA